MGCPVLLSPVCGAASGVTSFAATSVISAIVGWIVTGAQWLLQQLGSVIGSTTAVHVRTAWFAAHYATMVGIAAVVAVPMLAAAAVQSVYRQSAAVLVRAALVNLPLAGILTGAAVQVVQLALGATDALCTTVSAGSNGDVDRALAGITTALLRYGAGTVPTFVLAVGALLVVGGGFALWLELIVRAASVYVAVLFLPLALASLMWPGVSHWCRRLLETLAALILSKFVVVAVLSLATGAIASGTGFASVLAGGALLLLASFTPFALLRLVPLVEVGAALQLEHARHRVAHTLTSGPTGAASFALRQARGHLGATGDPGPPGTGLTFEPGAPGPSDDGPIGDPASGPSGAAAERAAGREGPVDTGRDGPGLLPLGPTPVEWLPPGGRRIPPGDVPAFEGTPSSVLAALEGARDPRWVVEPDGYGDVIRGVRSPLYGGTEPFSRFEPGPKDNWPEGWERSWPREAHAGADSSEGRVAPTPAPPFLVPDPGYHGRSVPIDGPWPRAADDDGPVAGEEEHR